MDLIDHLQALWARVENTLDRIQTEEATKTALVLPFINALGYNVFDPTEVVPEFTCDASMTGLKRGEKVDYAIMRGDEVLMLWECKTAGTSLGDVHGSQLLRYFHVTDARVGVLTNGIQYRFYSDLEEPNKMDHRPFLEIDLRDVREPWVNELKRLTKGQFNVDDLVATARELKYLRELRQAVAQVLEEPADEFVRLLVPRVYGGRYTQGVREEFTPLVKRAVGQYLNDRLNARLQSAIAAEELPEAAEPDEPEQRDGGRQRFVETTPDELEAFHIVRALLRPHVAAERVVSRDVQSYFGILLDDNNRKPICRLHFNGPRKVVETFDTDPPTRTQIETLDGLYDLTDRFIAAATKYDKRGEQ